MSGAAWLERLLTVSVQIGLVVWLARLFDPGLGDPKASSRVWMRALTSIVLVILINLCFPKIYWFHPWDATSDTMRLYVGQAQQIIGGAVVSLWIVGMLFFLTVWGIRSLKVRRLVRRSRQVDHDGAILPTKSRLLVSDEVDVPFCYQLHRPVVVLPEKAVVGDPTRRDCIMMHEAAHLNAGHPMQLFLHRCVNMVGWFHPSIRTMGARLSLTRECFCDDLAIEQGCRRSDYLKALVDVATNKSGKVFIWLGFASAPTELVVRARRIADNQHSLLPITKNQSRGPWSRTGLWWLGIVFITLIDLPINAIRSPKAKHSGWPTPTARLLQVAGLEVIDFEPFCRESSLVELKKDVMAVGLGTNAHNARQHEQSNFYP